MKIKLLNRFPFLRKFFSKDVFNKEHYERISYIFYPNSDYKVGFSSREEMTRENIGRKIVEDDYPVSFKQDKYFELYRYLYYNNLIE